MATSDQAPNGLNKRDRLLMALAGALVVSVAALIVVLVIVRPFQSGAQDAYAGAVLDPPVDTPAFTLTDQRGKTVQWSDYRGQVVVLTFLYTSCPDICPFVAGKLSQTYRALGIDIRDVTFVAISLDPERDSPPAIQAFSETWNMVGRWDYLSGNVGDLSPLWRDYGVGDVHRESSRDTLKDAGGYTLSHTSPVHVIDKQGKDRVAHTSAFTPQGLTRDIRTLLNER